MKRETLSLLLDARRAGRAIVRATDLETGADKIINPQTDRSELGQAAAQAARADQSGIAEAEGRQWFLSVFNPPLDLAIIGAVHIAQPLSAMASLAGYDVRIIDPRTAFATAARFPGITLSHQWAGDALAEQPLGRRSALVALTHDPKLDDPALLAALRSDCFYIGALGSRKTHAARLARLKAEGIGETQLERIHGPVGLNIGAHSPGEIAISILAEMTQMLRQPRRQA